LNFSRGTGGAAAAAIRRERLPRPRGMVTINDFQFYPPRLSELQEKEKYHFWKVNEISLTIHDCPTENPEEWLEIERKKIEDGMSCII
jgi:SWI/SNF-related matrix-associated actin-dependent regulator of chromatin subfamily A member 5